MMKKGLLYIGVLFLVLLGVFVNPSETQAAKKELYKVSGQKITVIAKNKSDITEALDAALKEAGNKATTSKKYTVIVPKGTYKINEKGLHIYSNTTLDLSAGVTLKYSGEKSHPMLSTGINGKYKGKSDYNNSSACKGYKGFKNIRIIGGKFVNTKSNTSTTMRLFHATNITLEGVTFSGGGGVHQLEVAAINGFYVKNCTFKDFGNYSESYTKKQEALQMDNPCSQAVYPNVYEDGTVMKNVEITGCKFSNVPRGVGSHTLLNGAYNENIKINNNTFKNVAEECIIALNYVDCEIKNNKITNCGAGILVQFFKATPESICTTVFDGKKAYTGNIQHDAKTVISGNTITTKYYKTCDEVQGIKVYGLNFTTSKKGRDGKKIPAGNYYISGVTVENNKITTAGYGIHMMDTRDCVVRNNTITGKNVSSKDSKKEKYDGILVENYAKNVSVTNNVIKNMKRNGIFVQQSAYLSALEDNQITGCKRSGINFYMKSGTDCDIQNNTIKNCSANGILISDKCKILNITSNDISLSEAKAGIAVINEGSVGEIKSNNIKNISTNGKLIESGIKMNNKAVVKEISNNKITAKSTDKNVSGNGILVYDNSKVSENIKNNTIGKVKNVGISISTNSTVSKSITENTINAAGTSGILVYSKSKVGTSISSNVIQKADKGISISQNSKVNGSIQKNIIREARREYYIDSSCKAEVKEL